MGTYIEHVQSISADHQAAAEKKKALEAAKWQERLTPLEERLAKLLSTIPPEIKKQGMSLHAIRDLLAGKWRGKCHPGELGTALRKLGYERRRNWSDGNQSFRALWFPPTNFESIHGTSST